MARHYRNINYRLVFRVIGWLLMIEAGFMVIPTAVCQYYGESDVEAFGLSVGATLLAGVALTFGLRSGRSDMGKHEGFMLTTLIWIVFSIFGMLPFILSDKDVGVTDGFFEAMSGFTTTGCSVLDNVESYSHGINMWRSLMQWIGGMGIILFTLAVIPMLNHSGGMQMFNAEVTGITHDKLRPRVSQTAKGLWGVYFLLTAILIGLLWLGPMSLFDSVCHAFSTISTGGFSTHSESLAYYDSTYVTVVVGIFMLLGGTSFALIYKTLHGDKKAAAHNDVFRVFIGIIALFATIYAINIAARGESSGWQSVTIEPLFQVISTITSTGLTVSNFQDWGPMVLALTVLLMFSGGCAGSTSGGAKVDRMYILMKNSRNELYKTLHPNAITTVRVNNKVLPGEIVDKVIAFLCMYLMVICIGGIALTAMGLPLVDAFFSAFSCVSNTGFGANITGYGSSFEVIPTAGKWVLAMLMLVGRLELFTVLVLFTRDFWRK